MEYSRKNTIGLNFKDIFPVPTAYTVHKWIKENLKLSCDQVEAIQLDGVKGSRYDLLMVDIGECRRAPCELTVGTNVNVTAKFVANAQSQKLDNDVFFFLNNVELDTSVLDRTCPSQGPCVPPNQMMAYTAEMAVSDELPPIPGQLVWQISNEYGLQVICFRVAIDLIL